MARTPRAFTTPRPGSSHPVVFRLVVSILAVLTLGLLGTAGATPARADVSRSPGGGHRWTGTWAAAASGTPPALPGTSIRNVVHLSVGGDALRVRITNRLGTAPLHLGAVTVALQEPGAPKSPAAVPGSLRKATFGGGRPVSVPAGEDIVTDPVPLAVPAAVNLLITLYTPDDSGPATFHRSALQTNFLAPSGNHTADEDRTARTATRGSS